jgi:predicted MPP superfamily phosphohydrolase
MTVALVSDIHASNPSMSETRLGRLVAQVNALGADLILLLGDYAGHVKLGRDLPPDVVLPRLQHLAAPLGVHAVFGNHDWRDDPAAQKAGTPTFWHRAFQAHGIPTYSNTHSRIETDRGAFQLAGLESQQAKGRQTKTGPMGYDDWPALAANLDPDVFTLLMAHEPDIFPDLPDWVDLTVSGHTHGGQIAPFGRALYVPSRHGTRYAYGHFQSGQKQLVVSAGLGYSGPPIRIGRPPEIVLLDIV